MNRLFDTPEDVENEIARLQSSYHVKLARKAKQVAERRRQYMYTLRMYEKQGLKLEADGITLESLADMEDYDA